MSSGNEKNREFAGSVNVGRDANIARRVKVGGSALFKRGVRIEGWLDAPNLKTPQKGCFSSPESLREQYPDPQNGWWAIVGDTMPGKLYRAEGGEWKDTRGTAGDVVIDVSDDILDLMEEISASADAAADAAASSASAAASAQEKAGEAAGSASQSAKSASDAAKSASDAVEELESIKNEIDGKFMENATAEDINKAADIAFK